MATKTKKADKMIAQKTTKCKEGKFYDVDHYTKIISVDTDCFYIDENDKKKILFKFRKNVIPSNLCETAVDSFLAHSKIKNKNRGFASGISPDGKARKIKGKQSLGNASPSNISGYFDRPYQLIQPMFPTKTVCRRTSFTRDNSEKWKKSLPFFEWINNLYKQLAPHHYQKQLEFIQKIKQRFRITNTVFSTITSNYNWRTACHKDEGDFEDGLGNLVVTGNDSWTGCYLGFPEFKIAVDVRQGDFLLMDVHQYHCNTKIVTQKNPESIRLSFVCYLREKMQYCNTKKKIKDEIYYYRKTPVNPSQVLRRDNARHYGNTP